MKKSLKFKKETVANLNSNELKQLQGGATYDGVLCIITVDSCPHTGECTFKKCTLKKCPETNLECNLTIETLQC